MNTVSKTLLQSHFNDKVRIYEIKQYTDNRGMVCETFRLDDEILSNSKMCYISDTNPFVVRGPHSHENQTDNFVSWNTKMVYQLYNNDTNEMVHFITDPSKIYLVVVEPPIIHSYRNIGFSISKTLNFPTSLFMGVDKKEKIDEIRHEKSVESNKNIYVFGSNGRLGKTLVYNLYKNMGYHAYHVIPIDEKFFIDDNKLSVIFDHIKSNKTKDDIIINCAAKTNVQLDNISECYNVNCLFAKQLMDFSLSNDIYCINFSTDYVYQQGETSAYTKSKIKMEKYYFNTISDETNYLPETKNKLRLIRVANLFSKSLDDTNNIIYKLYKNISSTNTLKIIEKLIVFPTDVEDLSKYLVKYVNNIQNEHQFINVSSNAVYLEDLARSINDDIIIEYIPQDILKCMNNPDLFRNDDNYIELNSIDSILQYINMLKSSKN